MCTCLSQVSCSNNTTVTTSSGSESLLSPVGSISRPVSLTSSSLCSESSSSSVPSLMSNYPKAPGFEREDQVYRRTNIRMINCHSLFKVYLILFDVVFFRHQFMLSHIFNFRSFCVIHCICPDLCSYLTF